SDVDLVPLACPQKTSRLCRRYIPYGAAALNIGEPRIAGVIDDIDFQSRHRRISDAGCANNDAVVAALRYGELRFQLKIAEVFIGIEQAPISLRRQIARGIDLEHVRIARPAGQRLAVE